MTLEQLVKQLPVWVGQAENNWKENKDCSFVSIFVMVMQKAHNSTLGYGRVSVNILGGGGNERRLEMTLVQNAPNFSMYVGP